MCPFQIPPPCQNNAGFYFRQILGLSFCSRRGGGRVASSSQPDLMEPPPPPPPFQPEGDRYPVCAPNLVRFPNDQQPVNGGRGAEYAPRLKAALKCLGEAV